MSQNDKEGSFVSHLAELRKRLIHSFIFLIVFFVPFCRYLIINKPSDINQNVDNEKLPEEIDNSVTDKMMNIVTNMLIITFMIVKNCCGESSPFMELLTSPFFSLNKSF